MLKIFLTDLAGYNLGHLRGKFITLPIEEKELEASIRDILTQLSHINPSSF